MWQRDAFQGVKIARELSGIVRGRDKYLFEQVRVRYSVYVTSREWAKGSYPSVGLFYLISFIKTLLSLYASSRESAEGAEMIYTEGERDI